MGCYHRLFALETASRTKWIHSHRRRLTLWQQSARRGHNDRLLLSALLDRFNWHAWRAARTTVYGPIARKFNPLHAYTVCNLWPMHWLAPDRFFFNEQRLWA